MNLPLLLLLASTGCAAIPSPRLSPQNSTISSHVAFLAQPKLKGRYPRSRGSRLARHYIEHWFRGCGLVPWKNEKQFALSFGYGYNILGVLPGSDPKLAGEIVLISAHYDHLGKDAKGRIYAGAADNASGVAVLLEIAKRLSASGQRPKRTVAFAAFDCEEQFLLGSIAFTCRQDVEHASIVSVINIDILGRDLLDAVQNTVFVAGTESYPDLRRQIRQSGTAGGIRVLPLSTEIIGPRSDHVAFESKDIPCLFFTSGIYHDYHQPTDTPNKLNFRDLERSASVIAGTLRALADNAPPRPAPAGAKPDPGDLQTLATVLAEIRRNPGQTDVKQQDVQALQNLQRTAENLFQSGQYDAPAREQLILSAASTLAPYLSGSLGNDEVHPEQQKEFIVLTQLHSHFYLRYRRQIMSSYHDLVARLLKYRPGAFRGMPDFQRDIFQISNREIRLLEPQPGVFQLNALADHLTLKAQFTRSKWLFRKFQLEMSAGIDGIYCEGARPQLVDFCLLLLHNSQTQPLQFQELTKLLRAVAGPRSSAYYTEALQQRLMVGHFIDEIEWIASCIRAAEPELALAALEAAKGNPDPRLQRAAAQIILDRQVRSDVRARAIEDVPAKTGDELLAALRGVVDDSHSVFALDDSALAQEIGAFSENVLLKSLLPIIQQELKRSPAASQTIGTLARQKLKQILHHDYVAGPHR